MSDFIPVSEVGKRPSRGKRFLKGLLIFICIVAVVAVISAIVINVVFGAIDRSKEDKMSVALSEQTVLASLEASEIPAPDLSTYQYVDTANLIGPRFEDVTIGNELADEDSDETYRDVTATATYRNSAVTVSVSILQRFTYDRAHLSWVGGDIVQSALVVTPLKALSTAIIEENMDALLAAYDADLADEFEGCSTLVTPSLDEEGGTAKVALSQTTDVKDQLSCTVELSVSWTNGRGWNVFVTEAGDVETTNLVDEGDTIEYSGSAVKLKGTVKVLDDGTAVLTTSSAKKVIATPDEDEDADAGALEGRWLTDTFVLLIPDDETLDVASLGKKDTVTVKGTLAKSDAGVDGAPLAVNVASATVKAAE